MHGDAWIYISLKKEGCLIFFLTDQIQQKAPTDGAASHQVMDNEMHCVMQCKGAVKTQLVAILSSAVKCTRYTGRADRCIA